MDKVFEIFGWTDNSLKFNAAEKDQVFRRRTASQIIEDGFYTGCTDKTLVFLVLARACLIPAEYVELLDKSWLENADNDQIKGHVIAAVSLDGKQYFVDPTYSSVSTKITPGTVPMAHGNDSWDIGITAENWQEKFKGFKRSWLDRKK